MPFKTLLQKTGLVAILRGVKPDEIVAIGEKLYAAGFRLIEIPMNSPEALQSITLL
ncbi:2-dehydro-3-deoxy-6-phosphogalactonate aldolase, partial [Escherichia coli]|nr:2-dehydro-3-deoxy-6-phosphogalactonate aldolase [Escherichia coli]